MDIWPRDMISSTSSLSPSETRTPNPSRLLFQLFNIYLFFIVVKNTYHYIYHPNYFSVLLDTFTLCNSLLELFHLVKLKRCAH